MLPECCKDSNKEEEKTGDPDTGHAGALTKKRLLQYMVVQNTPENIASSSGTAVVLEINENLT